MSFFYSQLFVTPAYPTHSFKGLTVIVTGSNVGLGFEAARHFARLGASKIILAVRNVQAGEAAKTAIETSTKRPGCCEVWELDLASFDSVKAFGQRVSQLPRLDIVVENAGVANPETFVTVEGHERHITINVISTLLLALLLIPKLEASGKAFPDSSPHLTIVTSELHATTEFPERKAEDIFAALNNKQTTKMAERYATSKLLEILVVREISPSLESTGVIVNLVNPGLCHSALARDYGWKFWLFKLVLARSTEVGSRTLLAGASADASSHGMYISDGLVAPGDLSAFVKSEDGAATQARVWKQLRRILEEIDPGCTGIIAKSDFA
jgi:NAD(P)-dependent dehydrogenase (short-subunit alcohol dehydrogenase family)